METTIEQLTKSWRLSPELHELRAGASESDFEDFNRKSGWKLPDEWQALYRISNGAYLVEGNVMLYPLFGEELSILDASSFHRSAEWPVPDQLRIAGDNGAGDPFGLWLSSAQTGAPPIVSIGAIFEPKCMSVAGSSLLPFLRARTAYYLMLCDGPSVALDALEVPENLRSAESDDALWAAIVAWADPTRPRVSDDPYTAELDVKGIESAIKHAA